MRIIHQRVIDVNASLMSEPMAIPGQMAVVNPIPAPVPAGVSGADQGFPDPATRV